MPRMEPPEHVTDAREDDPQADQHVQRPYDE